MSRAELHSLLICLHKRTFHQIFSRLPARHDQKSAFPKPLFAEALFAL